MGQHVHLDLESVCEINTESISNSAGFDPVECQYLKSNHGWSIKLILIIKCFYCHAADV